MFTNTKHGKKPSRAGAIFGWRSVYRFHGGAFVRNINSERKGVKMERLTDYLFYGGFGVMIVTLIIGLLAQL